MSREPDAANGELAAMRARIEQLASGYSLSAILFAAIELRLFDHLADGPSDAATLSLEIGASERGVARLCTALSALGFLQREAGGCFAAKPEALSLLSVQSNGSMAPVLLHHRRHIAPLMAHLADAVLHAKPQHAAWSFASPDASERSCYAELSHHPDEYALFLEAMDQSSAGVGSDIANAVDLGGIRTLIDMGGGGGRVARELMAAAPDLSVEMIDLPVACAVAERRVVEAGLGHRFHATPADFTKPLLGSKLAPVDAVLLSGVLADFAPADRDQILANAGRLLRPGGLLLVSETLFDDDRSGPLLPALLSLVMLTAMSGDNFTLSELRALLEGAGFTFVEHRSHREAGRRDLLVLQR